LEKAVVVALFTAIGHRDRGEFDQAVAIFSELIHDNPSWPQLYFERGLAHLRMGQNDRATADFSAAIRLSAEAGEDDAIRAELHRYRAESHQNNNDNNSALADLSESIRMQPNDADARCARAYLLLLRGENPQAIADYTEAIRLEKSARPTPAAPSPTTACGSTTRQSPIARRR
jgi:tetratricopeptide (TPR) repeat protein